MSGSVGASRGTRGAHVPEPSPLRRWGAPHPRICPVSAREPIACPWRVTGFLLWVLLWQQTDPTHTGLGKARPGSRVPTALPGVKGDPPRPPDADAAPLKLGEEGRRGARQQNTPNRPRLEFRRRQNAQHTRPRQNTSEKSGSWPFGSRLRSPASERGWASKAFRSPCPVPRTIASSPHSDELTQRTKSAPRPPARTTTSRPCEGPEEGSDRARRSSAPRRPPPPTLTEAAGGADGQLPSCASAQPGGWRQTTPVCPGTTTGP